MWRRRPVSSKTIARRVRRRITEGPPAIPNDEEADNNRAQEDAHRSPPAVPEQLGDDQNEYDDHHDFFVTPHQGDRLSLADGDSDSSILSDAHVDSSLDSDYPDHAFSSSDVDETVNPEDDPNNWVDEDDNEINVDGELASIAANYPTIPNAAIESIAALFRRLGFQASKRAETIKKTPRKGPGSTTFFHEGLIKGIEVKLREGLEDPTCRQVLLKLSADGLPLYKSSRIEFWPVLCEILNGNNKEPFLVSCYCGYGKPKCPDQFFMPALNELLEFEDNPYVHHGVEYQLVLHVISCDAPARSYGKCIKGHNGRKGCERCSVLGEWINNRMTFQRIGPPRTDESFRRGRDRHHHNGRSPFLCLKIDMVKQFSLDYMHLACLGVCKRFLKLLVLGQDYDRVHKLRRQSLELISEEVVNIGKFLPSEFDRKGGKRGLKDLLHWKAVEFRLFIVYTGPVILKGFLTEEKYQHFLYFHVGMRILLCPLSTVPQVEFARECLVYYSAQFGALYGRHHMVYNVHSLSHLADDRLYFKLPLDAISCFPSENFLGGLKRLLRGTRSPLCQIFKRLKEREQVGNLGIYQRKSNFKSKSVVERLNPNVRKDSYCMLLSKNQSTPVIVIRVTSKTETSLKGIPLVISRDDDDEYTEFYSAPIKASCFNIIIAEGEQLRSQIFEINMFRVLKCMALPIENGTNVLIIPLLSTMTNS